MQILHIFILLFPRKEVYLNMLIRRILIRLKNKKSLKNNQWLSTRLIAQTHSINMVKQFLRHYSEQLDNLKMLIKFLKLLIVFNENKR